MSTEWRIARHWDALLLLFGCGTAQKKIYVLKIYLFHFLRIKCWDTLSIDCLLIDINAGSNANSLLDGIGTATLQLNWLLLRRKSDEKPLQNLVIVYLNFQSVYLDENKMKLPNKFNLIVSQFISVISLSLSQILRSKIRSLVTVSSEIHTSYIG